jgi:hypothetical protein
MKLKILKKTDVVIDALDLVDIVIDMYRFLHGERNGEPGTARMENLAMKMVEIYEQVCGKVAYQPEMHDRKG